MSKPFYEAGRYEVEATAQGFTKAASSGNTQFVLRFKVKGRVDPSNPDKLFSVPAQYERTIYRALTDKTIEYFMTDMEALGVSISSFTDLDPDNPDHTSLIGKTFDAFCNHEADSKNQSEMREKWGIARVIASKPLESIASNEVKSLDRLFGKHLKKAPASTSVQRAAQPVAAAMTITDDDVPF